MDKKLFKLASLNNLEQFQIMKTTTEEVNIETFNDTLNKFETSNITKYLLTAIYQGKKVQLSTEELTEELIPLLKEQAEYLDIEEPQTRNTLQNIKEEKNYQIDNQNAMTTRMLNLNHLRHHYSNLKEITGYYNESIIQRTILTEKNELYDIKKEKSFYVEVLVQENNQNSASYNSKSNIDDTDIDIEAISKEAIQNAIDKLNYKEIKNDTYQVILTSRAMGSILTAFCSIFSADNIQKCTSLLTGKQNHQVFSEKITIVEDPTNPNLLGKRLFDDTGKHTNFKEIVRNGIFKQPLYDERTASIDKVLATGNDYGEISPRNMYIKPGEKTLEELIQSLEKGVLIDTVMGLHAGINLTNGDISLQSEGYYIENGQKQFATKLFVLSTNIMDILNNVKEISNHLEFYSPKTASPDVLLTNIKLSK